MSGISVGNGLSKGVGLSVGSGFSRGGGLYFSGFSVAPTLNLNFTTMTALPSTITFSRPSNATYYDSTGKLTYAPNNLVTYSQDFTNAAWVISGTVTRTSGQTDPSGGTTATKLDLGASSGIYQFAGSKVGNYVFSVWVKGDTAGTIRLSDASSGAFDLNVNVTTTWARVDTGSRAISGFVSPYINRGTGNLATVYVAFSQFELVTYQTTPGTYNATTSPAYYGARLDYNPATLAARGLLIEEARTNLALYSQDISNAVWGVFGTGAAKIGVAAATSPDGTLNAYEITTGTNGGTFDGASAVFQGVTVVNAVTYTASLWVRAKTGSATLRFGMQVGSSFDTGDVTVTTDWQRLTISGLTVGSGTGNFSIRSTLAGVSATVYIWGGQFEAGSFATSYIPTAGGPVSRSADTASMTGTNFSSWYNQTEGTFVGEVAGNFTGNTSLFMVNSSGAGSNGIFASGSNGFALAIQGYPLGSVATLSSLGGGTFTKLGLAYKSGDSGFSRAGASVIASTNSSTMIVGTSLQIGQNYFSSGGSDQTWTKSLVFYPQRLPNATLQSLTS